MMSREDDTLQKQFAVKQLVWPARFIYIRSFKYDSEMEVWVKNKQNEKYKLFKTYKICALAGSLGPKRMAGDYQVPEGFYYINEFNPRSLYHLSLGLNYPNASDRMLCDLSQPGGDIYIHGSCVTTGCIPITDGQIEELYVLAAHAKDMGQDFIPVHIFPVNFNNTRSVAYLNHFLANFNEFVPFEKSMQNAFYYFEKNHQVPPVIVNPKGEYVIEETPVPALPPKTETKIVKKISHPEQPIPEEELAISVDKLPLFPGGNPAFKIFIDKLSAEMIKELDPGQRKAFVLMEYIIDENGKTIYANAISGGNEKMNLKIEKAFTGMALWTPALRQGKNVPFKLKQTIMVEAP
ncbi:MAG TPA: L,D-transpeptidase family protein [Puia sp.]|nr:L,D-transpeptidase family protein [Puia sp.]